MNAVVSSGRFHEDGKPCNAGDCPPLCTIGCRMAPPSVSTELTIRSLAHPSLEDEAHRRIGRWKRRILRPGAIPWLTSFETNRVRRTGQGRGGTHGAIGTIGVISVTSAGADRPSQRLLATAWAPNRWTCSFALFARLVADDFAFDHVDHVFGDVGGHVGQPLQMLGDRVELQQILGLLGTAADGVLDLVGGCAAGLRRLRRLRRAPGGPERCRRSPARRGFA